MHPVSRARLGLLLLGLALPEGCGRIGFELSALEGTHGGTTSGGGRASPDGAANGSGGTANGSGGAVLGGGGNAGFNSLDSSTATGGTTGAGGGAAGTTGASGGAAGTGAGGGSASGGTIGTSDAAATGGTPGSGGAIVTGDAGTPVEIATAVSAWGITADGTNVYWTDKDGRTVNQRAAAGGPITVLAPNELSPRGIAVDATHVYWISFSNPGSLRRVPIGGGTIESVQPSVSWAEHLAIDGANAYWADQGSGTAPVYRTAKSGGTITALAPSERFPYDVASDGTDLYWTTFTKSGGVRAAPVVGGAARDVLTSLDTPVALALYGTDVFVAVNVGGTIVRVPKTGGPGTILAASQPKPHDIAVDASGVYWTNQGDESVRKLATGSTTPATIATNTTTVRFIATDAGAVYWTTATSVMRLVK